MSDPAANVPPANYLADPPTQAFVETSLKEKVATLHIRYVSGTGQVYEGTYQNKILTNGQRLEVERRRVQLSGGVSYDAMAPGPYALMYAICWLETSILSGPLWTKNLLDSEDEGLVGELWKATNRHEDTFFGRPARQSASPE